MDNFDRTRFNQMVGYIDTALNNCDSRDDFLMAASYMMSCSYRIFSECFGSEEVAIAFMTDFINKPIEKDNLKKIV